MIGHLKGTLEAVGDDWILLDVGGVGYEIACPSRLLSQMPEIGGAVSLSIETYVREEAIRLYGFGSLNEREWFRLLMTVQGVGAKVALAILGVLDGDEVGNAILMEDRAAIQRAPGVGKRVAERLVSELKSKVPSLSASLSSDRPAARSASGASPLPGAEGPEDRSGAAPELDKELGQKLAQELAMAASRDAISALVNLGYGEMQVRPIIIRLLQEAEGAPEVASLIRRGLKELAG